MAGSLTCPGSACSSSCWLIAYSAICIFLRQTVKLQAELNTIKEEFKSIQQKYEEGQKENETLEEQVITLSCFCISFHLST